MYADTISIESDDPQYLFTLDETTFKNLTKNYDTKGSRTLKKLFDNLLSLWSQRYESGKYENSFFLGFVRLMNLHGFPIDLENKKLKSLKVFNVERRPKFVPIFNISALFEDISKLENELRWNLWIQNEISHHSKMHPYKLGLRNERGQILHLVRNFNLLGMANVLSFSSTARWKDPKNEKISQISTCCQCSLQVLIHSDKSCGLGALKKFVILGENIIKALPSKNVKTEIYRSSLMAHLCEILNAAIVLNEMEAASMIIGLETQEVNKNAKYYKHMKKWNAYRKLYCYLLLQDGQEQLLIDPQIIAEELEDQLITLENDGAPVFVEAAIRLFITNEQYNRLEHCIFNYMKKIPHRGKNIIDILVNSDFQELAERVAQFACTTQENKLHPSDKLWLDWCVIRLKNPSSYGPLIDIYSDCVRVLFKFLDYGKNRDNENAWKALHFSLQNVNPEVVIPLWSERAKWWLEFHNERVCLTDNAKKIRNDVFQALKEEIRF